MLLPALGASLLGHIIAGKGINGARKVIIRAGYRSKRSLIKDF